MTLERIATAFVVAGALGWVLENALSYPAARYSKAFRPAPFPFLPVYGTGGVLIALAAPHLRDRTSVERAFVYGTMLTALELGACKLDRALGPPAWDYEGECVDLPHLVGWAGLSLAAEAMLGSSRERPR